MKANHLLFALLLVFFSGPMKVGGQTFSWAKHIGNTSNNAFIVPNVNALDANGNYYVLGVFNGTYDFDPGIGTSNLTANGNGQDVFIQKFSPSGNLIWAKGLLSVAAYQETFGLQIDGNGSVVISGTFDGNVDFDPGTATMNLSSIGSQDLYVVKLDSNGNLTWVKTIGTGSAYITSTALTIDGNNNIIVGGDFDDMVDFDPGPNTTSISPTGNDAFVLSLSPAGNFNWVKSFESTLYTTVQRLRVNGNGNIVCTGIFAGTTDFNPGAGVDTITSLNLSNFFTDAFVVELNGLGNFSWAKSFGGNDDEEIVDLEITNNNEIIIAGNFYGQADFNPNAGVSNMTALGTAMDAFILKLTDTGGYVWSKQLTGPSDEFIGDIELDNSGFIYCTGYFDDVMDADPGTATNNLTPAANSVDGFVLKLDNLGNFVRVNQINSAGDDEGGFTIAIDATNSIYSTGLFGGTIDFDPQATIQNLTPISPDLDVYYLKWNQCTPTTHTINATGCSYTLNGQTYSSNGTYTQILPNASGCDSIITINLTGSATPTYISPTVCNTLFSLNGQNYAVSGNYVQNYTNQANCDSNIYINLTVGAASFNTMNITACDFYASGPNVYTSSGVYNEVHPNASGCDSNLTINLTILQSQSVFVNESSCGPYLFNNQLLTTSGSYSSTFLGSNGCDSTVNLNLTIIPPINTNVTLSGNTLTSQAAPPTLFQWVTCPGYVPITGATGQSFTPSISGDYAVILSQSGCADTSACQNVIVTGINETAQFANSVQLFPNPVSDELNVKFEKTISEATLHLTTMSGKILETQTLTNANEASFRLTNYAKGLYFVIVNSEGKQASFKITKE